jgi:hypothetical protein
MAKKKRTKEIEYAVKYLHETKQATPTQISLELGVEQAIIEAIIAEPPSAKEVKLSKKQNLMINQTAGKKVNNVSIMTEAASQRHDEFTKNIGSAQSRSSIGSIHRPNG